MENDEQSLINLSVYLGYHHNFPKSYHLLIDLLANSKNISGEKLKAEKTFSDFPVEVDQLNKQLKKFERDKDNKRKIELVETNIKMLGLLDMPPREMAIKNKKIGDKIAEKEWFKNLKLPEFYYPEKITSLSFGINEGEEFMGFREFYSTQKATSEDELPFEANQVMASTSPLCGSKLLLLSPEKQRHYYRKVLEPLLVNFYIATSKDKEEAVARLEKDIGEVSIISDVLKLIQRKIIWPIEMELEAKELPHEKV